MPRKRRPGRPRKHGGRRVGAGRPPLEGGGTELVGATLTPKHIEKVKRWLAEHEDAKNFSGALRQIIDAAIPD